MIFNKKFNKVEETENEQVAARKRGFTMIELIGAMIIIAILTVAGITAIATAISNSRMSATQTDLSGFQSPIEQFMLENPQMAKEKDVSKIAAKLDEYLEGEMQFKTVPTETDAATATIEAWQTKRNDAWDEPFRIYIDPANHSATQGKDDSKDTELRIFVISNGKNSMTGANNNKDVDGDDDMFLMVQLVNGQVSHGMYGMRDGDSLFAAKATKEATVAKYTAADDKNKQTLAKSTDTDGVYAPNGKLAEGSIQDLNNVVLANTVTNKAA